MDDPPGTAGPRERTDSGGDPKLPEDKWLEVLSENVILMQAVARHLSFIDAVSLSRTSKETWNNRARICSYAKEDMLIAAGGVTEVLAMHGVSNWFKPVHSITQRYQWDKAPLRIRAWACQGNPNYKVRDVIQSIGNIMTKSIIVTNALIAAYYVDPKLTRWRTMTTHYLLCVWGPFESLMRADACIFALMRPPDEAVTLLERMLFARGDQESLGDMLNRFYAYNPPTDVTLPRGADDPKKHLKKFIKFLYVVGLYGHAKKYESLPEFKQYSLKPFDSSQLQLSTVFMAYHQEGTIQALNDEKTTPNRVMRALGSALTHPPRPSTYKQVRNVFFDPKRGTERLEKILRSIPMSEIESFGARSYSGTHPFTYGFAEGIPKQIIKKMFDLIGPSECVPNICNLYHPKESIWSRNYLAFPTLRGEVPTKFLRGYLIDNGNCPPEALQKKYDLTREQTLSAYLDLAILSEAPSATLNTLCDKYNGEGTIQKFLTKCRPYKSELLGVIRLRRYIQIRSTRKAQTRRP